MSWITHPMRATICSTICAFWRNHKDFLYEREKSLHQLSMCTFGSGTGWYSHNHIRCPPMDLLTQQMSRQWSAKREFFLWSEVKAQHDMTHLRDDRQGLIQMPWALQGPGLQLIHSREGLTLKKQRKETKSCLKTWLEVNQDQRWLLSSLDPADSQVQLW